MEQTAVIRFISWDRGGACHQGVIEPQPGMVLKHNFDLGEFRITDVDTAKGVMKLIKQDWLDDRVSYLIPREREVEISKAYTVHL
jgi:hypothetical protein